MEIKIGSEVFQVVVIKKKRKTISLKIDEKGEIILSSPLQVSNKRLEELLKSKEAWIASKLELIKGRKQEGFNYERGVSYLGKNYPIKINEVQGNTVKLKFDKESFNIHIPLNINNKEEVIKDILIKWYKAEARRLMEGRVSFYAEKLKVQPKRIFIKDQKTKWGSCSSKGNINLNYRIIMAPMEVVDYLVVHELCHLVHLNHSKDFWRLVESIIPNFKVYRNWLKINGGKLRF